MAVSRTSRTFTAGIFAAMLAKHGTDSVGAVIATNYRRIGLEKNTIVFFC